MEGANRFSFMQKSYAIKADGLCNGCVVLQVQPYYLPMSVRCPNVKVLSHRVSVGCDCSKTLDLRKKKQLFCSLPCMLTDTQPFHHLCQCTSYHDYSLLLWLAAVFSYSQHKIYLLLVDYKQLSGIPFWFAMNVPQQFVFCFVKSSEKSQG